MFALHLIAHPTFFEGEVQLVNQLLADYEVYFHLRKPNASDEEYLAFVEQLDVACYDRVVLHACYQLAEQGTFAACHYSTAKRCLVNVDISAGDVSTSCHSLDELAALSSRYQQCFLSPVFDSISKQGYHAAFEPQLLRSFLRMERDVKVLALGGIDASTVVLAQAMGFDGAAVLGAVWGQNPHFSDDFSGRLEAIIKAIS